MPGVPHPPLPFPEEMARWDAAAAEFGILPEILMENASRAALDVLARATGDLEGRRVLVVAGPGNNGGDAFALARHLDCAGAEVRLAHTKPLSAYRKESGYHVRLAKKLGLDMALVTERGISRLAAEWLVWRPEIVIDGLLGTGFAGSLSPFFARLVQTVNVLRETTFVLALDVPSGLSARDGRPSPEAVRAHATATFEAAKFGLALPWAARHTGWLHVRPIGIPPQVKADHPVSAALLGNETLRLLPPVASAGHKGAYGHVLVLGGSYGLTGAPVLAALGALRSGAGLATVGCPSGLSYHLKAGIPDVMTLPLGKGSEWNGGFMDELGPHLSRFDALVCGPGLGRTEGAREFLRRLLAETERPPLILDADALYWLAKTPDMPPVGPRCVITPHPREAALLLDQDTDAVQGDRYRAARALADRFGCVCVLKGAGTLVASPDAPTFLLPHDVPSLSTAGSGDVLAGCLGTLLGRGLSPLDAACLATWLHARAGLILDNEFPARGCTASDIAAALPRAMQGDEPCARPRT